MHYFSSSRCMPIFILVRQLVLQVCINSALIMSPPARTINKTPLKSITAYLFHFIYFSIKYGKACGLDEIPVEVWKLKEFHEILLECCNSVYQQEVIISSWRKGCILPFPKKGNLNITKNYRGITLTAISAKIYNLMPPNKIRPAVDPLLRKNQNGFRRKRSTMGQILTIRRILGVRANNLPAVLLFIDFSKAFDSIHRGKMRGILIAYGIPQERVDAIIMLHQDTCSMVRSPDGNTEFFDIIAGVLQGDTLAPYIFIICLDYVLRRAPDENKKLRLTLTKQKSRRYPKKKDY